MDPPGNRKGTEGEKWHLTQEAGGFYPATFIQAYPAKPIQRVSVIFAFITENPPTPFSPTPQREHRHGFPQLTCQCREVCERGEGMCVYSPIPRARDTPCFSATPPGTPPPPHGSRASTAAEATAPALELLNRPAPAGKGNAQNRHSNRRSPAATTKIFNSHLNLTGKGNCQNLAIAPNTSQMLRFTPVSSRSLAFFIRSISFFRYSLGRVYITLPCKKYIFISLV